MSTSGASAGAVVTLPVRKVERDLHVSEALLVVGVALYVAVAALLTPGAISTSATGNFAFQVLVMDSLEGLAGVLTLVGAIFAAINWSLLRKSRSDPRAPTA
jgi:hypothetical protein